MSTDLVPVDTFALVPAASDLASQIAATDFAPQGLRGKPAAVMAAMLQGHELGIGPMQALSQIAVINGKPCMSAQLMRALVQRAGHDLWFESKSNTKVVIAGRRSDWPEDRVARVTWTMDDAKAAGLQGGQNYRKYPRAMLAARATSELCRDNFADVLGGISYTPEELSDGDLVADGDLVIEGRDDIAPDAPPTNRRQAGRAATAKKAPAKKAAAPKASAPAPALPEPPLPGEPGFDDDPAAPAATDEDIVDAEVVDDEPPATLVESLALVGLTAAKGLRRARELAGEHDHPLPMAIEEVSDEVLDLLVADLGLTRPAGGGEDHRDRRLGKMWAMVAEAWPGEDEATLDGRRKGLISVVTNGRTSSSKAMEPAEWDDLFEALEQIADGSMELFQRSSGEHEMRMVRGAS
jgi:hypothetical protein